ncbi:hypothetical protein [cyanobacterium endosymbiont of Rhopalodia gibberula]|uniref:hypothetical protein n=1 Tax=cyanobacterium endosymbiont of Rhopalodia gibberula TaxID=1763363 RepID=UPI000E646758|nr:hypothetical protein [cyanobacterium endosymbiont of Rhopalodia gibberula]
MAICRVTEAITVCFTPMIGILASEAIAERNSVCNDLGRGTLVPSILILAIPWQSSLGFVKRLVLVAVSFL